MRTFYSHLNVGRNDPCPCGSGKKFKKCCIDKPWEASPELEADLALGEQLVKEYELNRMVETVGNINHFTHMPE